jgi:flagellar assembly protein FliH
MSNVIKAPQAIAQADRFTGFSLRDVQDEAREIIARARSEAETIRADAQRRAEQLREQAHRDGYQAGEAKGLTEGREAGHAEALARAQAQFAESQSMLTNALTAALDDADRAKRTLLAEAYQDLIDLAMAVAERVIKRIGQVDRQAAVENAREAVDLAGRRTDMVLEVHPDDYDAISTFVESLFGPEADAQRDHVRIVAEPAMARGGCRFRSAAGAVDATLEAQIERVTHLLLPQREDAS